MTVRAEEIDVGDLSQRVPVPHANDELQHLARTLNAMLGRLEHGVAAREQLVADASHELRGPLAAMRAELEVSLHNDDLGEAGRAVVASAREEVVRMGRIVENLLTLARVDDGHLDLLLAPHDLNEIAARGARPYAAAAAAAGLTLTIRGEPLLVTGDGDRLEQVVGNLVDNAVRVGPPGSAVVVTTAMRGHAAVLTVSDAGPGVPDEARTRIFERFGRADSARTRPGGAGLGLAICREIVSAHGGDIRVDPNEHGGATFVVTLRAIEDGAARLAPPPYDEHAQLEPA
jgi:signal transduction histidine kinase